MACTPVTAYIEVEGSSDMLCSNPSLAGQPLPTYCLLVHQPAMARVDLSVVFNAIYFVGVLIHFSLRCRYMLHLALRLRLDEHPSPAGESLRAVTRQYDICVVVHSLWILFAIVVMLLACLQQFDAMIRFGGGLLFCQDLALDIEPDTYALGK